MSLHVQHMLVIVLCVRHLLLADEAAVHGAQRPHLPDLGGQVGLGLPALLLQSLVVHAVLVTSSNLACKIKGVKMF